MKLVTLAVLVGTLFSQTSFAVPEALTYRANLMIENGNDVTACGVVKYINLTMNNGGNLGNTQVSIVTATCQCYILQSTFGNETLNSIAEKVAFNSFAQSQHRSLVESARSQSTLYCYGESVAAPNGVKYINTSRIAIQQQ